MTARLLHSDMQRINVVGTSGSGKSTFGRRLATQLDLPYMEMDRLYWGPDWSEPDDASFLSRVQSETEQSRWVLDGNYSRTTRIKWRNVQMVVWLDLSLARTLFRVTSRSVKRSLSQREIWPGTGNRETLSKTFLSRDSIVLWSLKCYHRNRRQYAKLIGGIEFAHVEFVRLRNVGAIDGFLQRANRRQ